MTERLGDNASLSPERLRENAPLAETERFFAELYNKRDSIYLPDREIRADLFLRGIDDLNNAVRHGAWLPVYEVMFARIVSRIFCVARGADNVSVVSGLERKYPIEGCAYCGKLPCECPENRNPYTLSAGSELQKNWSIRDWQKHLSDMYGEKNRERGLEYCLLRLVSEHSELISLEHSVYQMSIDEVKDKYTVELADAMAWTMANVTLLNIDLQTSVEKRYGNGCKVCQSFPCDCRPHKFDQISRQEYGKILGRTMIGQ